MAQKKKKGTAPKEKKVAKPKKSTSQIIYMVVAIVMALLMVGPLVLSFFQ